MHVRELPPLRLHIDAVTPAGRHYRWGSDEPRAENVADGLRFSDTMPGGFESMDCTLARKPGTDYPDLERLSTLRALGAGGDVAWEGRLERAPRTSGDQMAINPSAVGWQAHLDDNKSVREIYVDRDLSHWTGPSVARRIALIAAGYVGQDPAVTPDPASAQPSLLLRHSDEWLVGNRPAAEATYDGRGVTVGALYVAWKKANVDHTNANYSWTANIQDGVDGGTADASGALRAAGPSSAFVSGTSSTRKAAFLQFRFDAAGGSAGASFDLYYTCLAVYGGHGLPGQGTADATNAFGLLASHVVRHAILAYAPRLRVDDSLPSIQPSSFIIPHLVFLEPTSASEIVRQATRFGLQDWAVWDDKTFYWHERGARGRNWRARIAPTQLEETGPQLDRLWESIIVQYQDADGSTRTVGPPGSGADTESADLKDDDPENPANKLGIIRRDLLTMGVSTAAGATEVGRRFLEQTKLLDSSGRARIVGHVMDDHGILHPYWRMRAGDTISFIDAADPSPRRIVRTDKSTADRSCAIDLDAPPDAMAALLERLGVVLVPFGL